MVSRSGGRQRHDQKNLGPLRVLTPFCSKRRSGAGLRGESPYCTLSSQVTSGELAFVSSATFFKGHWLENTQMGLAGLERWRKSIPCKKEWKGLVIHNWKKSRNEKQTFLFELISADFTSSRKIQVLGDATWLRNLSCEVHLPGSQKTCINSNFTPTCGCITHFWIS